MLQLFAIIKFFYEVLPNIWHEHIVPLYHRTKATLTSKELKADAVLAQTKTNTNVTVKQPKTGMKMTKEESDAEKWKALYHWIGLLDNLTKLQNDGGYAHGENQNHGD